MNCPRAISNIVVFSKIVNKCSRSQPLSRYISQTVYLRARIIEVVPALGESITEGSIASWNKSAGDSVAVDDVIVIVETDKVTVDIKSTNAGIFVAKLAEENVTVGAPLYELETSELGVVTAMKAPAEQSPAASEAKLTPEKSTSSHSRIPSIKFLGKRSLIKTVKAVPAVIAPPLAEKATTAVQTSVQSQPVKVLKEGTGVDFRTLKGGAMFGRAVMSQREMDAIENGGATN